MGAMLSEQSCRTAFRNTVPEEGPYPVSGVFLILWPVLFTAGIRTPAAAGPEESCPAEKKDQSLSTMAAQPIPPPTQRVASPFLASLLCIS